MLRALVAIVLLANLFFFGWVHDWFDPWLAPPGRSEHEPQRLLAQVHPEAVTVLAASAASAALRAARASAVECLQAGPFAAEALQGAESALAPAQLPSGAWSTEAATPPPPWLVYAGRYPDPALRRTREAELDALGLAYELIESPADLGPGLVLSRHATEAAARSAASALAASAPSLHGVRVVNLPASPPASWLRVAQADPDQQARLRALPADALAGGFRPCPAAH